MTEYRAVTMTLNRGRVLRVIGKLGHDSVTKRHVSEEIDMHSVQLSRTLRDLRDIGWVTQRYESEKRNAKALYGITEEGARALRGFEASLPGG